MSNEVQIAELVTAFTANVSGLAKGMTKANGMIEGFGKSFNVFEQVATGAVRRVGEMITNGIGKAIETAGDIARKGIDFNAMQEQASVAFETMLGSAERAQSFLGEMQAFAKRTPFEYPDLIVASRRLMALGFASEDVMPMLTSVGDAVAALGGGKQMIDRVTLALGQMKAKGKVQAEEMMQLAENGIPAWEMLAKTLGVTIPKAMKMVEQRRVSAATGIEAITDGINERFGGMMAKQADTWQGLLSNLKDTFGILSGQVMKPVFDGLRVGLKWLVDYTSSPTFTKGVEKFATKIAQGFDFLSGAISRFASEYSLELSILTGDNATWGEKMIAVWDMVYGVGSTLWGSLLDGLVKLLPEWWNNLSEWGPALWEWIKTATPLALEQLGKWAGELWQWALDNGPEWLKVVDEWARYLWQWIVDAIPGVKQKLGDVWDAISGWVTTNGPIWWNAIVSWGEAIGNFAQAAVRLIAPIWEAINSFVTWKDVALAAALTLTVMLWPAIMAGITAIGAFISAWGPFAALFVAAIAAIALFRTAWEQNWWGIQERVNAALTSIQARFGPLLNAIQQFGGLALAEIVAWVTGNEVQFTGVKAIWEVAKQTFGIVFTEIGMKIKEFGQIAWTWFAENFPKTAQALMAAVSAIQAKWNELWSVIGPTVNAIIEKVTSLVTRWQTGTLDMGGALDKLKIIFDGIWAVMVKAATLAITTIMDALKLVAQLLIGDWAGAWETAKGIVNNVFLSLTSIVLTAVETILKTFGFSTESVRQWAVDFVLAVNRVIDMIKIIAKPFADMLAQFFSWKDVLILIGGIAASVFSSALIGAIGAAAAAVTAFVVTWGPLIAAVGLAITAIAALRHAWETNWGGIRDDTQRVWQNIQTGIRAGLQAISTWFYQESGLWHGSWEETFEYFAWWVKGGWKNDIYFPIRSALIELTWDFEWWRKKVILTLRDWYTEAKHQFDSAWPRLAGIVATFVSGVTNDFEHLKSEVIRKFEYWTGRADTILTLWKNTARATAESWRDDFLRKVDEVKGWFTENKWVQLGRDTIQGIWNGAVEIWGRFKSWWDRIWGNDVPKTVSVKMEMHSPSKVMEQFGAWTMEGFAIGANNALPMVETAMGGLSAKVLAEQNAFMHDMEMQKKAFDAAKLLIDPNASPTQAPYRPSNGSDMSGYIPSYDGDYVRDPQVSASQNEREMLQVLRDILAAVKENTSVEIIMTGGAANTKAALVKHAVGMMP